MGKQGLVMTWWPAIGRIERAQEPEVCLRIRNRQQAGSVDANQCSWVEVHEGLPVTYGEVTRSYEVRTSGCLLQVCTR